MTTLYIYLCNMKYSTIVTVSAAEYCMTLHRKQGPVCWLREWDTLRDELKSPMAAGSSDILWRSIVHLSGISLSLNMLLCFTGRNCTQCHKAWTAFSFRHQEVQLHPDNVTGRSDQFVMYVGVCYPQPAAPVQPQQARETAIPQCKTITDISNP